MRVYMEQAESLQGQVDKHKQDCHQSAEQVVQLKIALEEQSQTLLRQQDEAKQSRVCNVEYNKKQSRLCNMDCTVLSYYNDTKMTISAEKLLFYCYWTIFFKLTLFEYCSV